jgi:ribosome biogenesis GTPase A
LHHFDEIYDTLLHCIEQKSQNFALTVGVPNVGKSSVLASLLRLGRQRGLIPKNAVKTRVSPTKKSTTNGRQPGVEDKPGKTREITEYLLREKPSAFFMDVPGITPPGFYFKERPEVWFSFGATNLLPLSKYALQNVEMQKQFCDYILCCANRDGVFHYVDKLRLDGPTDDINECLSKLANKYATKWDAEKLTLKRCENFLKLYNTGNLGSLYWMT